MSTSNDPSGNIEIELRNPVLAAILAWLLPGLGHFYQRRFAKGLLFMVCILSTFIFGLALGEGKVVYTYWPPLYPWANRNDVRWQYYCQAAVGLPALPAVVQAYRVHAKGIHNVPWSWMREPIVKGEHDGTDDLAQWNRELKWRFELATLYTMVAGLLNVLAIYDALAGPFVAIPEDPQDEKPD